MQRIQRPFTTEVLLTYEEAIGVCKLTQGKKCCAFLLCGPDGWECGKRSSLSPLIIDRLEKGTMVAKGKGGWEGCAWKNEG